MNQINKQSTSLPHHRLAVYGKSLELLAAVRAAQVRDAKLRDEALRAAKGTCLNIAEGAGRVTRADKGRAYAIARGGCDQPSPRRTRGTDSCAKTSFLSQVSHISPRSDLHRFRRGFTRGCPFQWFRRDWWLCRRASSRLRPLSCRSWLAAQAECRKIGIDPI